MLLLPFVTPCFELPQGTTMSEILCIIDGMNDPDFNVKKYPTLASFPRREHVNTVPDGFKAGTLPCVLSLLGFTSPPKNIRGWIEALGAGIDLKPDDLIFRGSWVEVDDEGIGIGFCDEPDKLPKLKRARYVSLGGYKGLLIIPKGASFVDSIPALLPFEMLGRNARDFFSPDIPALREALIMLNSSNPRRLIIPWAASVAQPLPPFPVKAAVVSATNIIRGLAKALKMYHVSLTGMTGDTDTDLGTKTRLTLALAKKYPFTMLHIGGCDEAAHRMDKREKEAFLMQIDQVVLPELLASNHTIRVVSDHGADPATGGHTGGKQPSFVRPARKRT